MSTNKQQWRRQYAHCLDCEVLHPESTRLRVRQHVTETGHKARFVVEDITEYSS